MRIPPPGSDPTQIAEYVDALVQESTTDDKRIAWEPGLSRGQDLYLGNHYTTAAPADQVRIVLNRIQNAIISIVAIQAGDLPKVTFTPRESGEPALCYLNTNLPQVQSFTMQLQASGMDPNAPLPDAFANQVRQAIAQGEMLTAQAQAAGLPAPVGILPAEALIEVSDRTAAEALQTVFDGMWDACGCQYTFVENVTNKNIFGIQPTLYEFDDLAKQHILTNIHPLQVFYEKGKQDQSKIQYFIYDEPISADEAKALYPDIAAEIEEHANSGSIPWSGSRPYNPGFSYTQQYRRDMIAIRHSWIRSQPYPMLPEEAVVQGKLEQRALPDGDPAPAYGADGTCSGCGVPGMDALAAQGMTACPQCGEPLVQQPTRPGYFAGGEEVTETTVDGTGKTVAHPKWPVRYGIRQNRVVANRSVFDRETEFGGVPIVTNVNIPVPFSIYGQGEPVRLEGLQMALNRVISAIVTHQAYNAYPPEYIPASVVARMDKALQKSRTSPGQRVVVPDDLLQKIGNDIRNLIATPELPSLPTDVWKLLDFLVSMIDKEGNQADVLQGNASSGWSGDAINSLQNAASQVIRGKSQYTEFYLRDLAKLMVHSIINRMGPADWRRYCSKFPIQAIEALHQKAKSIDVDIVVQISSGSGASKQSATNNLMQAAQAGVPISPQTLIERLGEDPDVEASRSAEWARKQAQGQPQQRPAAKNQPAAQGAAA